MKHTEKKQTHIKFYIVYTLAMLGIFGFLLVIFISNGKSFVRIGDGLSQHYVTLAYWGKYLRSIIRDLLFQHKLRIPMWDLKLAYGSDILTTLHYYVVGDPLNLLAVFVPERYTEYLYDFLIFLRFYLAGIAFCSYCFYHKSKEIPVFLGSLIYVYSQWMIVTGMEHPYFLNPCIYLPLIMLGIDKIYEENRPYLYMISLALAAVSNFYFFYMLGIFTVIYAVFRYFVKYRCIHLRNLGIWLGYFCIYTVTAVLIAAVILLPMVLIFLSTSRISVERYVPILYSKTFYQELLAAFAGKYNHTRFSCIGVSSICVPAVILLFTKGKKYLAMVIGVLLTALFVSVPFFGHMLNGFSYTSNRWVWVFGMLYACIFVKMWPEFFQISAKQRVIITAIGSLYALWLMFAQSIQGPNNFTAGMILLVLSISFALGYRTFRRNPRFMFGFFAIFLVLSTGCTMWFYHVAEPDKDGGVLDYADIGSCYSRTHGNAFRKLSSMPDISQVRYDQRSLPSAGNSVLLNDNMYGGRFAFSIIPGSMGSFFDEMYMNNYMEQSVQNLNSRAWMMKLFSMGYYVGPPSAVPYNYQSVRTVREGSKRLTIYQDPQPLPFAYTFDTAVSESDFLKLNPIQRQEALLQSVVLRGSTLPKKELILESQELPFTVSDTENLTYKDDYVYAEKANAGCTLTFEGEENSETYLAFTDLLYMGRNKKYRPVFEQSDLTNACITAQPLDAKQNGKQEIHSLSPKDNFTSGRTNYAINFMYREEPFSHIRLTFKTPGKYKLGNLQVFCQKMNHLSEFTAQRTEEAPADLSIDGNHITCSVVFSKTRELVLSIPYSKGWRLYVDGNPHTVHEANRMFLGAEIPEGKHQIEFVYMTPYLPAGIAATILGLLLFIIISLFNIKKRKLSLKSSGISGKTSI